MPRLRRDALWVALIAILVFGHVLGFGFVYDDAWTIVDNRWLERPLGELLGLLGSGNALALHVPDATRPWMVLAMAIDRKIFGLTPFGFHLHSLVLYGACVTCAVLVAFLLTRQRAVALFAGVFFALAPLHAEPVAAVNYREDLYASFGVLAALACVLGGGWIGRPGKKRRKGTQQRPSAQAVWRVDPDSPGHALAIGAVFALALFAKESAVVLLPLFGLGWWLAPWTRRAFRERTRALIALAAAGVVWAGFRVPLLMRGDDIPLAPARGMAQLILRTARFEVQAVRHALFPWSWSPDPFRQPNASVVWLLALVGLVVLIVVLARMRRTRLAALGLAFALVAPLPSSPLLRPINEYADRYFVLGVLGGGLFWGVCAVQAARWLARGRSGVAPLPFRHRGWLGALCLPLLVPTWHATAIWKSERSLWNAAVERSPGSARAWSALARLQRLDGDPRTAERSIERAVELEPRYAPALVTRVYGEIASGRLERARQHLREIHAFGLADTPGVRKAEHCLSLEPGAAQRCIGP